MVDESGRSIDNLASHLCKRKKDVLLINEVRPKRNRRVRTEPVREPAEIGHKNRMFFGSQKVDEIRTRFGRISYEFRTTIILFGKMRLRRNTYEFRPNSGWNTASDFGRLSYGFRTDPSISFWTDLIYYSTIIFVYLSSLLHR